MMMNVLALCLVLTSLVSAGFFTPSPVPEKQQHLKQNNDPNSGGVVIELEKEDGNTKVFISPQDHHDDEKGYVANAKEKLSETLEGAKEKIVGGGKEEEEEEENGHKFSPRELVCDAYGKCKHKIASAMGKTKDVAADTTYDAAEGTKDAMGEAMGKVKDTVTSTAKKAYDKAQEMKEGVEDKVKEKASEMKQGSKEKAQGGVYNVKDKAYDVKEEAKKAMGEGIGKVKDTVSGTAKKASDIPQETKQSAQGATEKVKRQVSNVREKAKKAKEWMGTATGVLHLVGLAAAYGMGLWVTFGSNYVLGGALTRPQFGMVQSKIYPVYFKAMAFSLGMGLLGHLLSGKRMVSPVSMAAALGMTLVNLLYLEPRATKVMFERMKKEKEEGRGKESYATEPAGVAETTGITSTTEPAGKVTTQTETVSKGTTGGEASTEGVAQEKPEEKGAKVAAKSRVIRGSREILRRINSYSSVLNVLTLMSLTWHLVHLAHHLHTCC